MQAPGFAGPIARGAACVCMVMPVSLLACMPATRAPVVLFNPNVRERALWLP